VTAHTISTNDDLLEASIVGKVNTNLDLFWNELTHNVSSTLIPEIKTKLNKTMYSRKYKAFEIMTKRTDHKQQDLDTITKIVEETVKVEYLSTDFHEKLRESALKITNDLIPEIKLRNKITPLAESDIRDIALNAASLQLNNFKALSEQKAKACEKSIEAKLRQYYLGKETTGLDIVKKRLMKREIDPSVVKAGAVAVAGAAVIFAMIPGVAKAVMGIISTFLIGIEFGLLLVTPILLIAGIFFGFVFFIEAVTLIAKSIHG